MREILFIGDCGNYKDTSNGVYAKNIQLLNRLKELFGQIKHINTNKWKQKPFVLLIILYYLFLYRRKDIIISLNTPSAYKLIKVAYWLFPDIRINYFVIGGILPNYVAKITNKERRCYSIVKWFMVESKAMKLAMEQLGYKNVLHIPNFKKISYIPKKQAINKDTFKFVFLSRIMPEKGCNLIIEAIEKLNKEIGDNQFLVHFYGKIDISYKTTFIQSLNNIPNAEYKGFLNLAVQSNYDILANYSAMLFPTYWEGEGFPGILIDAMIAGTPVIASDWGYNSEIIENGKTGVIIKSKDVNELSRSMLSFINNTEKINTMSLECTSQVMSYDTSVLLNNDLFEKIITSRNEQI